MSQPFDVLVAVDIRHGQAIRLTHADTSTATSWGSADDAIADFVAQGADWIHVADLDAAFGEEPNDAQLAAARKSHQGNLQISGGLRTAADVRRVSAHNPDRIVLSAAALADLEHLAQTAEDYPGLLWAGIDVRDGVLTARGASDVDLSELVLDDVIATLNHMPLGGLVVTDVARDGALTGPPLDLVQQTLDLSAHHIVVSGGVRDEADLLALRAVTSTAAVKTHPPGSADSSHHAESAEQTTVAGAGGKKPTAASDRDSGELRDPQLRGLSGAIVGRAFYTGSCTVSAALSISRLANPRTL